MNLWAIFITGLTVGGLSCMVVQGGLLTATIAQREQEKLKKRTLTTGNSLPILMFLLAKLFAYTILGFVLGSLGAAFTWSITATVIMQLVVVVFMVGTALNILNVHPVFRYFVIQPPHFLTRIIRKKSKSDDFFALALLGAFTVAIPCGATQAMMALAIASGNPLMGAAILFVFILGTSPVFFLLGYFTTKLGDTLQQKFMKFAAVVIILLAIFNANNTLALTGSNFTLENIANGFYCTVSYCNDLPIQTPVSSAAITIEDSGYLPNHLTVKAGSPVTIQLKNNNGTGCTQSFTIPSLGVQKVVPVGSTGTLTFTAPQKAGPIAFMCSMGMYRGTINVI
ncbi:MAG: sulfite exporter TauE/SafE family protein [Candidatus Levyibacteriota bacterium]